MASETDETPTDPVEPPETADADEATEGKEEADVEDIGDMSDVLPPPPPEDEVAEDEVAGDEVAGDEVAGDEVAEDEVAEDEVAEDEVVEKNTEELSATAGEADITAETEKVNNKSEESVQVPDFSDHKTNVAERLWRAKKAGEETGSGSSPDIVTYERDFQEFRKNMALLNKYVDEYATAMQEVVDKRNQLFKHYALLSEGTPLFDRIGEPLPTEYKMDVNGSGNTFSMQGIEEKTHAIMKASDELGAGSLMAHQELAMMQEEMNLIDFKTHTAAYINEWDDVVSSTVDYEIKEVRLLERKREHYIEKVDGLRQKVNKIEHKGKQVASKRVTDKLARNEDKLARADAEYTSRAAGASVLLDEATKRSWVDLYPVIKNVMKFEINRLGRESTCYGSFHNTLAALKTDYKEATINTVDHPSSTSKL